MKSFTDILTNSQLAIAKNKLKPIANRLEERKRVRNFHTVDILLRQYEDLIEEKYIPWFAERLYTIPFDQIHTAGKEARRGRNPKRLFAFLIKKYSGVY